MSYCQAEANAEGTITVDSKDMIFNHTADYDFKIQRGGTDVFRYDYGNNDVYVGRPMSFVNGVNIDPHITTANQCTFDGGDTTGDILRFNANSADTYPYINMIGSGDMEHSVGAGDDIIFDEAGTDFVTFNRTGIIATLDTTAGDAVLVRWSTATSISDIVGFNVDTYNSITMGTDDSATAIKADVIKADGTGTSYLIDGYVEGSSVFQVDENGKIASTIDATTGSIHTVAWSTTTSTGDLVALNIDGVTNLTMGTDFGVTGVYVDVIAPDGTGKSYPIDLNVGGSPVFNIDEDGVINIVNGVKIDPHITSANRLNLYGGGTAGDDIMIYANSSDTYPNIWIGGADNVDYAVPTGKAVRFFEEASRFFTFDRTASDFTTDATTTTSFVFDVDSVTSGVGVRIQAGGLQGGNALEIAVDTDIVTTGKAINVYSGASMNISVFSIDEDGEMEVTGKVGVENFAEGGTASFNIRTVQETVTLSGATKDTSMSIPNGCLLFGASFNVDTAVVDTAGDDTWSAAYVTGSATALAAGAAAAQNTKVDTMVVPELSSDTTEIRFTPNGGNFSSGVIEVVAYYIDLTSLANV